MAILNSQLFWWYLSNTGTVLSNNYFRFKPDYIKPFPMPIISKKNDLELQELVDQIFVAKKNKQTDVLNLESKINEIVYGLYNLTIDEINTIKNM